MYIAENQTSLCKFGGFFIYINNMKLNELVYDIREKLSQYHDDSSLSDEHIIFNINNIRSVILKSQMNSFNQVISPIVQQSLCLELESVSPYDCEINYGCERIIRTVQPIPTPIKHYLGLALTSVRTVDRLSIPMIKIDSNAASYIYSSRGKTKGSIYYFIGTDMRLYIVSKNEMINLLECITVTGIFSNPLELENYKKCCDCDDVEDEKCYDYLDSEYPMDMSHADDLTSLVIEKLLIKMQTPKDTVNDAKDENQRE